MYEQNKRRRANVTLILRQNTRKWKGDGTEREFREYIDSISFFNVSSFDMVFVDGRARVACAKAALPYMTPNSTLFLHDWDRKEYSDVTQWYTLLLTSERMAMFRKTMPMPPDNAT